LNKKEILPIWIFTNIYIQARRRDATHSFSPSKWKKTKFTSSKLSHK